MSDLIHLSIVTTLDPYPGVMPCFIHQFRQFANKASFPVELIIVNGMPTALADASSLISPGSEDTHIINSPTPDQGSAILYGIKHAKGKLVLSIDPDMHGNINDIATMLACHQRGDRLVYTRRRHRHDAGIARRTASRLFNVCLSLATGTRINDFNSPMFLISRDALNVLLPLQLSAEAYKFHAYYLNRSRFSQVDIDVSCVLKKKSNYDFRTLLRLFFARLSLACRYRNFPEG